MPGGVSCSPGIRGRSPGSAPPPSPSQVGAAARGPRGSGVIACRGAPPGASRRGQRHGPRSRPGAAARVHPGYPPSGTAVPCGPHRRGAGRSWQTGPTPWHVRVCCCVQGLSARRPCSPRRPCPPTRRASGLQSCPSPSTAPTGLGGGRGPGGGRIRGGSPPPGPPCGSRACPPPAGACVLGGCEWTSLQELRLPRMPAPSRRPYARAKQGRAPGPRGPGVARSGQPARTGGAQGQARPGWGSAQRDRRGRKLVQRPRPAAAPPGRPQAARSRGRWTPPRGAPRGRPGSVAKRGCPRRATEPGWCLRAASRQARAHDWGGCFPHWGATDDPQLEEVLPQGMPPPLGRHPGKRELLGNFG